MLCASQASRRLALLFAVVVLILLFSIGDVGHDGYLPKYNVPGWSTAGVPSSAEDDQGEPGVSSAGPELGANDQAALDASVIPGPAVETESLIPTIPTTAAALADSPEADSPASTLAAVTANPLVSALPQPASPEGSTRPPASPVDVRSRVHDLIASWQPNPVPNHWPPYEWYGVESEKDYDPNRWEGFEWDAGFYLNNGIKKLKHDTRVEAQAYLPYPDWNSEAWREQWNGEYVACEGPRGRLLNDSAEDMLRAYPAVPNGFPRPVVGAADAVGVDLSCCFDRFHRYGQYGFGQGDRAMVDDWHRPVVRPGWTAVNWGMLQEKCVAANRERWFEHAREPVDLTPTKDLPVDATGDFSRFAAMQIAASTPAFRRRAAVLVRTSEGHAYSDNDRQNLRALITELSLLSGGEYQVFLLLGIRNTSVDIFTDRAGQRDLIHEHVPREFRDITLLYNEKILREWYPDIGDWQDFWHPFMPLQWFSENHPEFEYIWNWELDARFTGSYYQFLEAVTAFAREMPRKHLWERSQRYYVPSRHGSWRQFLDDTDVQVEQRRRKDGAFTTVWGPVANHVASHPLGPQPPYTADADKFEWGVGEEADLITLQPIWDPRNTEWIYKSKIWNFVPGVAPNFTPEDPQDFLFDHADFADIPRRTFVTAVARFSRRQLHAMHLENLAGRAMAANMWPATVALHHGLKAVYAPHPIWTDRKWPDWYLDVVFNANGDTPAEWGQMFDAPYSMDREHNFGGWSWHRSSGFPTSLFRRWLGLKDGADPFGEQIEGGTFENEITYVPAARFGDLRAGEAMVEVGGNGRMCLPPMLLHPVQNLEEEEGAFIPSE